MAEIERIFTISKSSFAIVIKKGDELESFVICSDYEFDIETHEAEVSLITRGAEEENNIKELITINPPKSHNISIECEKVKKNKLKIIFE